MNLGETPGALGTVYLSPLMTIKCEQTGLSRDSEPGWDMQGLEGAWVGYSIWAWGFSPLLDFVFALWKITPC